MIEKIKRVVFFQKGLLQMNILLSFLVFLLFSSINSLADTSKNGWDFNATYSSYSGKGSLNDENFCPIVLFIEPVAGICIDSTISAFQLTVTIQGSDGSGFGVWSGPGIVDPLNGVFNPTDSSTIIGNNVVTYTFVENGCVIAETTIIALSLPPDAGFVVDNPVCSDDMSNIVSASNPGSLYEWDFNGGIVNSGSNEGPYEISWPAEGFYTIKLQVTNPIGCKSVETQTIEVIAPLDDPIINCYSTTTEIVFNWNDVPGALDHEVTLVNGTAGTEGLNLYSVSGLNPGGDSVTIQVSATGPAPCGNSTTVKTCYTKDCPQFTINLPSVEDICLTPGATNIELIATLDSVDLPGIWSGNGIIDPDLGIFNPNDQSVTIGSNKLIVTFTDDVCVYKDSISINVFEIPIADAGIANEISCSNSQVSLSGNATGSNLAYNWAGPGIVSGFNSLYPVIDIPGTYFFNVTDTVSSCAVLDSVVVVTDHNVPLADAGADREITCDSLAVTLWGTSSIGQNYQYIWHGPGINQYNQFDQHPTVSLPGYYILQVVETVNDCYSPKDSVLVTENNQAPLAEITSTIDAVNCEVLNDQLIGNIILNGNYQWLDPFSLPAGNTNLLYAGTMGTYVYLVTNTQTGCVGIDSIFVNENTPYPIVDLSVSGSLDCDTKEVILDGSNSYFGQNIVYSWAGPGGGIVGNLNAHTVTVTSAGNYTLIVSDTTNNCSNETTGFVLEVFNAPTATVNRPDEIDCNILKTDLDGSGSTGMETLNYQWIFNSTVIAEEPLVSVNNAGTYTLIVSNFHSNCSDTTSVDVFYNSPPVEKVNIDVSGPSCYGENDGIIVFDSVSGGTPSFVYSIDGGQNFNSLNQFYNLKSGTFDFVIEDTKGCRWDSTMFLDQPEKLQFSIGDDMLINMGDSLILSAEFNIPESQVDTIIWYPSNILECRIEGECFEVSGRPVNSFYARATLIDLNGCIAQDKIKVEIDKAKIAYVPNTFSPNGDNKNDRFTIYAGNSVKKIKQFAIYNRWGKTIYEGINFLPNDPAIGWDGTLNGKPLNPDVFVYWAEVELIDGQKTIFKGEVTLIK